MAGLTPKQEAFALAYVETGNASEAYRRSYDVSPDSKPETIWTNACQLLGDTKVSQRVFELQSAARERTLVTVESITKELEQLRSKSEDAEQFAPAITAVMGKAKVNGLLIDKQETKGTFELTSKEQRDAAVERALRANT